MPDFAPNWTPRLRLTYQVYGAKHKVQFRFVRGHTIADAADMGGAMAVVLNALAPVRHTTWTPLSLDFAPMDSDVFLPVAMPTITGGTNSGPAVTNARQ